MMTKEKIDQYAATLRKERERLVAELKAKEAAPEDFGDDVDDAEGIEAQEAEGLGTQLAIGQALRDRIEEIDEALRRVEEGKYGICTKCGKEISERVLDVAPESALCEECKRS